MTATQKQRQSNTVSAAAMMQNYVYVLSDSHAWIPARVMSMTENGSVTVAVPQVENEQSLIHMKYDSTSQTTTTIRLSHYPNRALPLQNVDSHGQLKEVEDMVELSFLHEPAILYNLKARHVKGKPYTRTGDIVIAVNPYQWIDGLYSEEKRRAYSSALVWNAHETEGDPRSLVEPHVYETSALAYRGLACEGMNQSILVSGESGAGKTETVKILLSHLASVQARAQHHSSSRTGIIVKRVLDSNPLLEAFGNAKTVRNDNSSRFGKFLQLQFDCEDPEYCGKAIPDCLLAGSKCETYLLEKSRVVSHETATERTYHIFYQLLSAPNEFKARVWDGLVDTDNESFAYVGFTDTHRIEGLSDFERFEQTCNALALIGIKGEVFTVLMRAITIVLQLGNLVFEEDPHDDEKAQIITKQELQKLSSLMQVDEQALLNCFTNRTVKAGGEEYKVPLSAIKAKDSCDAFAKEIYSNMFQWLVRAINDATCAEKNYDRSVRGGQYGLIGLLDIFGFESFETNRFEQLCINYANEKLQQKFTNDIFRSVKQEYEFEGIELAEIQYDDNQNVLNLVEGTTGLISVLNEECIRPKGSDSSFVSKVKSMNKGSDCLINKKLFRNSEFGVKHFAGPVVYDANGFVTKNTDTLPLDLLECAKKCSNDIVRLLNDAGLNSKSSKSPSKTPSRRLIRKSSSIVAETVWTKFRNQLVSLMDNLGRTRTRYIRCIKPNTKTKPYLMQHTSTVEQLRCAGVVAAVTISRSAFPNRLEHEEILHRFKSLWPKGEQRLSPVSSSASHPSDEVRRDVDRLLTPALSELETQKDEKIVKAFVIGKTRTYFRAGALEHLEAERLKGLGGHAIEIQRFARGFLARRLAVRIVKSCIVLQCWTRCNRAKREYSQLRENKKAAKIQSLFRMIVIRKAFLRTKAEKLRRQKEAEQSRQQKTAGAAATAAAAVAAAAAQHQSKENGARHAEAELDGDDKGQGIEIEFDPNEPSDDIDKENQFAPELDLEAQDEFENKSIDENSKITSKETMSPLSQDKEGASWLRRHRRLVIVGTLVVVAAIVGIVVGVVLATGGGGGGESVGPLKQFLIDNSLGDGTEFDDPESYQSKAYTWLQADPSLGGYSEERTLQRYAVACIYYATYAVRTLITDIVNESEEIPPGWKFTTGWLSNQTECDWLGLVCDEGDRVSQIDLYFNSLTGSFPAETSYLASSLQVLDIRFNDVWNVGEEGNSWLGKLTALRDLNIGFTYFENEGIPTAIGLLTNLEDFDCWNCLFDGPLDGNIFSNLNALTNLDISGSTYGGTLPSQIVALPNLKYFYATQNGWTNNDLSFLLELAALDEIWIHDNPDMGGTIPTELYTLPSLASMSLSNCTISGSIPSEMGLISNLIRFWVDTNPLIGTVPTEMGNLSILEVFDIADTMIGGSMPEEVCELRDFDLQILEADCNQDPPEINCTCCTNC